MNIILLGPERPILAEYLTEEKCTVLTYQDRLDDDISILKDIAFIISYGYRYIIPGDIVERFYRRAINLHISYLPWNRGADPNLWSFIDDTPKGVTIHYIDNGLDTGDIIVRKRLEFNLTETLRTSYDKLSHEIELLFMNVWPDIRDGRITPQSQMPDKGTYHMLRERAMIEHLLTDGWDTPVKDLISAKPIKGGNKLL